MSTGPDRTKRRNGTSCDTCKKRKVRCIGATGNNGSCNTCAAANLTCTYSGTFKNRVISKDYIERLESRLAELELLLQQAQSSTPQSSNAVEFVPIKPPVSGCAAISKPNDRDELELSDDEFDGVNELQQGVSSLSVTARFHGRSSSSRLVRDAFDFQPPSAASPPASSRPLSNAILGKRPEFWSPYPWEIEPVVIPQTFDFPEQELFDALVALFFEHINILYGLLHRPTFEALITDGLHHRDPQFANVVLLVLANGSRYSKDHRVVLEGSKSWLSSGWKWFSQVNIYSKTILAVPSLFNLQAIVLYTIFIQNSPSQEEGWSLISAGVRLAMAMGAHRKKVYGSRPTINDELWKRAFWFYLIQFGCLYIKDRQMCLSMGRPVSLHDEDFDLDLPVDCDDEYWIQDDPNECFKQPPDKPSKTSFLVIFIELHFVLSYALITIYSINKSKASLGYTGQGWEERLVAELDSRLNDWEARIPTHVRFAPDMENPVFFVQAAILCCTYHDLRILVHHPFVAPGGKASSITHPCLATCDNAARACSGVASIYSRRMPHILAVTLLHTAFTSAVVLFFKLFSARRAGQAIDLEATMAGVHGCMRALENAETRSWSAGRHRDILYNLARLGDLPLPPTSSHYPAIPNTNAPNHDIARLNEPSAFTDSQTKNMNDPYSQIFEELPPLSLDTDEQVRNMWNNAPMTMGFNMDWDGYINTLNWMATDASL